MKLFFILLSFFLIGCATSYVPYSEKHSLNWENVSKIVRISNDQFVKNAFAIPIPRDGIYRQNISLLPYVGFSKKTGSKYYILRVTYASDNWIFMNRLQVNCGDKVLDMSFKHYSIDRDVSGGSITETIDVPIDKKYIYTLSKCIKGNATIKITGKSKYATKEMRQVDIDYFREARFIYLNVSLDQILKIESSK